MLETSIQTEGLVNKEENTDKAPVISLEERREQKRRDIDKEQYLLYYERIVSTGKALPYKEQLIFDQITDRLSEARDKSPELDIEIAIKENEILQKFSNDQRLENIS